MRIAFVGLGVMGAPMAAHLQRAGHEVRGHNRSPGKGEELVAAGGTEVDTLPAALEGAEAVCLMLPDGPDVEAVMGGEDGVLARAAAGTLVVDFSTVAPDVARRVAGQAADRGMPMVDAPVSGGQAGAREARLSVMVGGEEDAVRAARPPLEAVGATVVHVGPPGAGQVVKAANQVVVAGNIQVLSEAVVLLESQGIALDDALDVLAGGLAGSAVLTQKRDNLVSRRFEPGFRLQLHDKDLRIAEGLAAGSGLDLPVARTVAALVAQALDDGDAALDHSALIRGLDRRSPGGPR
ncbi:NAD(P)-dependent oxidoreductase [uncultured Serinicoccus sp.]|uniref:NAD(P)-dependent oxidoreductase n=1 Tax=uncultured Serinicoccus sp. TaxID=735514 RepID=UPI002636E7EB|nr:NAD(P)-dependent oxidoreductase [uncultured Serinicoccus sp.]